VVVSGNTSDTDGGGVAVSSGVLVVRGATRFESNVAIDDGGAVALNGSVLDDTEGTVYLANTGSDGGALYAVGGTFTLVGAQLEGNVAAGSGGGIALYSAGTYVLEDNHFLLNSSVDDGGGLLASDVSGAGSMVRNNRFQDNTADGGGGAIAALGATAGFQIANNTITGSSATTDEGSGILVGAVDSSGLEVLANVLHSCDGDSAVYVMAGSAAVVLHNTVWQTNSGMDFAGEIGDGDGDPLEPTNVVRNPLLVAMTDDGVPGNDDLTLQGTSPEIDSGPPQAAFDDPDGSLNDRGYTGGPAGVP
jgi:predicted outer membrane repeat protein